MFRLFPYFNPKLFCFFCIWLLVCLVHFFRYFRRSYFYIVLPCQGIFWVTLLPPKSCDLFVPAVLSDFSVLFCLFLCVFTTILLLWEFFTSVNADGFHWSLSDSKSPQVSRTLLSILTDLLFGWSPLVVLFLSLPVHLQDLWIPFRVYQLQVVSPSSLCSLVYYYCHY